MLSLLAVLVAGSLSTDLDGKNRPVTKVINLLKDMATQMEKEQEEDEEVYEKVACWCETNDKSKTVSIADAEGRITDLTSTIEELTASSARLNTEIKNLNSEIAKNQAALDKATAIRKKELAEFNGEEKDMLQSIGALKSAVAVLSKHHDSFAQVPSEQLLDISAMINHQFIKYKDMLREILTPKQKKASKPKRPLSAYMLFCQERRPALTETLKASLGPGFKYTAVMTKLGEEWRELSDGAKVKYQDMAAAEKAKAA